VVNDPIETLAQRAATTTNGARWPDVPEGVVDTVGGVGPLANSGRGKAG